MWREGAFESGLAVTVGTDGRIARVAAARDVTGASPLRLSGRALLPGFANAHSHAFQRLLRGHGQWRPVAAGADFWSWRQAMFAAAARLTPDDVEAVARFAFLEMLRAGYTAVGEFHYLRRDPSGAEYADRHEIAARIVVAARDVGIRITLLDAAYAAGGIGAPLGAAQRRFDTPDVDGFLTGVDDLRGRWRDDPAVAVGVAAHSVRAVPRPFLAPLAAWARGHEAPLHAHVSEQEAEVTACVEAYGRRPVELLADEGFLDARCTVVHATHVDKGEIGLLGAARSVVCVCPTTERDLGDGILPALELTEAGADLALGSDSHVVIDPFEEMRALEGHERLRRRRRVLLGAVRDDRYAAGPALLAIAARHGSRSLGVAAGTIEPGAWADLVAVDLEHPAMAGWSRFTLAAHLAVAAPAGVVTDVWVAGERRVEERRHRRDAEAREAFDRVAKGAAT